MGWVQLDFAFDYVDEVDETEGTLPAMKGRFSEPVQPDVAKERVRPPSCIPLYNYGINSLQANCLHHHP